MVYIDDSNSIFLIARNFRIKILNVSGIIEKLMFGLQTQNSDDGNSIFLKHSAMYNVASSIWCRDLS